MKTLYLTQSSDNIIVDPETDFVGRLNQEDRYALRAVYYIEEPIHVVYQFGEEKEEIDARKGDLLLVFYSDRFNLYHLDTIRTKQWAANIRNRHKIEQQEKEEWAAKQECKDCDIAEAAPKECECAAGAVFNSPENIAEKQNAVKKLKKALKKITNK